MLLCLTAARSESSVRPPEPDDRRPTHAVPGERAWMSARPPVLSGVPETIQRLCARSRAAISATRPRPDPTFCASSSMQRHHLPRTDSWLCVPLSHTSHAYMCTTLCCKRRRVLARCKCLIEQHSCAERTQRQELTGQQPAATPQRGSAWHGAACAPPRPPAADGTPADSKQPLLCRMRKCNNVATQAAVCKWELLGTALACLCNTAVQGSKISSGSGRMPAAEHGTAPSIHQQRRAPRLLLRSQRRHQKQAPLQRKPSPLYLCFGLLHPSPLCWKPQLIQLRSHAQGQHLGGAWSVKHTVRQARAQGSTPEAAPLIHRRCSASQRSCICCMRSCIR